MPTLENCHNIADLRTRAQRKLPAPMFHYIDGGADDEWTMQSQYDGLRRLPTDAELPQGGGQH